MTQEELYDIKKLGENIDRLMQLVRSQAQTIEQLKAAIGQQEERISQMTLDTRIAQEKANTLLTARAIATSQEEIKQTKQRLDCLIGDIDKCIALMETE
ncbi:MAG: hypothetical protein SPI72_01490 [Porphyromonas sp.]|nr:hypothetical protein [Porphyromonas sp.]